MENEFLKLIEDYVDILFGNEEEIKSLFEEEDFYKTLTQISANKIDNIWIDNKASFICFNNGSNWEFRPPNTPSTNSAYTIETYLTLTGSKESTKRSLRINHTFGTNRVYLKYCHITLRYTYK